MINPQPIMTREIHVSQIQCKKSKVILLNFVCPQTGDVTTVLWDDAPFLLRQAALEWGFDPFHLLANFQNAAKFAD